MIFWCTGDLYIRLYMIVITGGGGLNDNGQCFAGGRKFKAAPLVLVYVLMGHRARKIKEDAVLIKAVLIYAADVAVRRRAASNYSVKIDVTDDFNGTTRAHAASMTSYGVVRNVKVSLV